jgi:Mg2+ and Co2+ transporter CorA
MKVEYIPKLLQSNRTDSSHLENKTGSKDEETIVVDTDVDTTRLLNAFSLLSTNPSTSIFETSIDLTPERLDFIFQSFNPNTDDKISYASLREGISVWALSSTPLNDQEFTKLVTGLDSDGSSDISREEFGNGLQMIALRRLFSASLAKQGSYMTVLDYNAIKLSSKSLHSIPEHQEFYHQKRENWVKNRWIDTTVSSEDKQGGAITLQRLAVKYRLHPLAVEDALEYHRHRPKVEAYSTHYVLFLPILSLTTNLATSMGGSAGQVDSGDGGGGERDGGGGAGGGGGGGGGGGRCCCRRRQRGGTNRTGLKYLTVDMVSIFVNVPQNDTLITFRNCSTPSLDTDHNNQVWSRIKQGLNKTYSKLRQYDVQYLLYGMLDTLVDRLPPIVEEMRSLIVREKKDLIRNGYHSLERIDAIRDELATIIRQLKPFQRVLVHVIKDDAICKGATIYLHDVSDNLECCMDDFKNLLVDVDNVEQAYEKFHQGSMDRTLYLMTVVTSIFLPAQFLAGVWGMNFSNMPELQTDWVYPMFWLFTVCFTVLMLYFFNCGRLNR